MNKLSLSRFDIVPIICLPLNNARCDHKMTFLYDEEARFGYFLLYDYSTNAKVEAGFCISPSSWSCCSLPEATTGQLLRKFCS